MVERTELSSAGSQAGALPLSTPELVPEKGEQLKG